ncbi:MAG: HEAT repeat domain-containing protein [Planctomycetota bacterium]
MILRTLALAIFISIPAAAQSPSGSTSQPAKTTKDGGKEKDKPAATWPKLDGAKSVELGKLIDDLKRAPTEEHVTNVLDKISEFGNAAVPLLLESLSRQKPVPEDELSDEARRLIQALELVIRKDDGPLLVADAAHRSILIRRYALRKCGEYAVTAALSNANKGLKDHDEGVRFEAALCCAAVGSTSGFGILHKFARDHWPVYGARLRAATEKSRSEEATEKCKPGLSAEDWQDVCASLRLLSGWGTKAAVNDIAKHLDSSDHRIKEDAINTLRGIVDNEQPLEKLSAFDLAEQARAWRKRI